MSRARVCHYVFVWNALNKERSNYLIIISWRVQRSTCASADSPNITFDILTRFRNISFYRLSYFKNGLIQNVCYANNNKKALKRRICWRSPCCLEHAADDNEVIMIIITSIWTLSKNPTVRVPSHPYTHYNAFAFILIHILKVKWTFEHV